MKKRRDAAKYRGAFTLLEVVISCAIVSIILLATQSALVLLLKTTPDGKTGPSARVAAAKAIDLIAGDLRWANAITKDTPNEIIFTVPDRNGDGVAETIHYVWSGNAGDPLYRQINGGGSVSISNNVQAFSLTYNTGTVAISGGTTTSAEQILCSFSGSGLTAGQADNNVTSTGGVGEYFVPTLPSNAVLWNVTRLQVYMKGSSTPNQIIATLATTACGLPVASINSYQTPQMGTTYSWIALPVTASNLDPHSGLCFEILGPNNKITGVVETLATNGPLSTPVAAFLLKTTNGTTWTSPANQSLLFYAYGTYVTPNPTVSQTVLTGVRCTLQAGNDPATQVVTSMNVPNTPVLP